MCGVYVCVHVRARKCMKGWEGKRVDGVCADARMYVYADVRPKMWLNLSAKMSTSDWPSHHRETSTSTRLYAQQLAKR